MGVRIVVAEDDVDLREALVTMLRREGHEVVGVDDAASLVQEVTRARTEEPLAPGLVIADLRLGSVDVLAALEELTGALGSLDVILISGDWTVEQQNRARSLGAHALLAKPFHFRYLRQLVRKFDRDRAD